MHRDIAARNCLLGAPTPAGGPGEVAVADFGLACVRPEGAYGGGVVDANYGPLCWMAPEQWRPPYVASLASDAFSFGVLLWEIYSPGRPDRNTPWSKEMRSGDGRTRTALRRRIMEGQRLAVPRGMPDDVARVMKQCFDADPRKRPTLEAVREALGRGLRQ